MPVSVRGINRREILRSFQLLKGGLYEPNDLSVHLKWWKGDQPLLPPEGYQGKWTLVGDDVPKSKKSKDEKPGQGKRKAEGAVQKQAVTKKSKTIESGPVGMVWNSVDHSCSYDAVFTPLYDIWQSHGPKWSDRLRTYNPYTAALIQGFESFRAKTDKLESARDRVRRLLHHDYTEKFPNGPTLTALDDLAASIFGSIEWGVKTIKCNHCNQIKSSVSGFCGAQTIVYEKQLHSRFKFNYAISNWLTSRKMYKANKKCTSCGNGLVITTILDRFPPCFYLSLSDGKILIDPAVTLNVGETKVRYTIRGVIYNGDSHFTCRIIKPNGSVWYHDGIETGKSSEAEGSIHTLDIRFLNSSIRGDVIKKVAGVIYAREDE
ncbi:hypothetical protein B0H13DRAFT_2412795 [Mycena leptocephala]|nr:hypothetical protein B0H13DRAFT_2412795 [Mycena leptocephala]